MPGWRARPSASPATTCRRTREAAARVPPARHLLRARDLADAGLRDPSGSHRRLTQRMLPS